MAVHLPAGMVNSRYTGKDLRSFLTGVRAVVCTLLLALWLPPARSVAQKADSMPKAWAGFGIEANALGGKVFKHEVKFTLPIPAFSGGADVNFMLHTYGRKPWEQRRGYPTLGIALAYIDYGIADVYGSCIGLYPNITLPIISGRQLEWTLRVGDGIGYVTRRYSRANPVDTVNVAIGAHLNDFLSLMTDLRYHVNEHWDVQLGANINHISNGSFRKPNLGVNMVGMHVGVRYFPVTSRPVHIVRDLKPLSNRYLVQAHVGMSLVSSYTAGGPLYPVYNVAGYVSRRWHSHNKAFVGLDYAYHQNIYAFLRNNGLAEGQERANSYKATAFAGNEFIIGRVGIMLQVGAYLKKAYVTNPDVYEKVGGNYYFVMKEQGPVKELFISTSLKTHLNVAELGEVGIGVGF